MGDPMGQLPYGSTTAIIQSPSVGLISAVVEIGAARLSSAHTAGRVPLFSKVADINTAGAKAIGIPASTVASAADVSKAMP